MIAQPRPGEDALAAAAILELCRTIDEAVEHKVIRDMPPATPPSSPPITPLVSASATPLRKVIRNTPGLKLVNTGTVIVGLVLSFLLFTEEGRQTGMLGIFVLMGAVGAIHH
jgi:hypothetical protein